MALAGRRPALLAIACGLGTGAYLGRIVDRRLEEAIAAADREDPNWRIDDLLAHRDVVPDDENSAIVVAEALERLPDTWPPARAAAPGQPNPPSSPVLKAFDRMVATAENVRLDDATARAIRDELKLEDTSVQIARSVADFSRGRHELELGPTLYDTRLAETQAARTLARLLEADAAMRVHDGDIDGSLDSCRALLGVGRSVGDEPFAISMMVRVAIGVTATRSARRILGQGEPADAALMRLQDLLLDELSQSLELHAMRGERAMLVELIRRVANGEVSITELSTSNSQSNSPGARSAIAPWGKLMFDNQQAVALELMNEAVAIAQRPRAELRTALEILGGRIEPTQARSLRGIHRGDACTDDAGTFAREQCTVPVRGRARVDGDPNRRRTAPTKDGHLADDDRRH